MPRQFTSSCTPFFLIFRFLLYRFRLYRYTHRKADSTSTVVSNCPRSPCNLLLYSQCSSIKIFPKCRSDCFLSRILPYWVNREHCNTVLSLLCALKILGTWWVTRVGVLWNRSYISSAKWIIIRVKCPIKSTHTVEAHSPPPLNRKIYPFGDVFLKAKSRDISPFFHHLSSWSRIFKRRVAGRKTLCGWRQYSETRVLLVSSHRFCDKEARVNRNSALKPRPRASQIRSWS